MLHLATLDTFPMIPGDECAPRSEPTQQLLRRVADGDGHAHAVLFQRLYEELHNLAGQAFHGQPRNHTLQATALVHEAYLKVARTANVDYADRRHFLSVASKAMRQILVDHARARGRAKRSAAGNRVLLDQLVDDLETRSNDLMAFDEALTILAGLQPRLAQVVEMRFFAGMRVSDVARALEVSERRIERDWVTARAWLRKHLE